MITYIRNLTGWEWSNHFWLGSWSDPVDKWMLELWRVMVLLQWMHVHISILNTSLISGIYNVEGNLWDVNWSNFFCEIFLFLVVYIAEVAVNSVSSNYIPFMFCISQYSWRLPFQTEARMVKKSCCRRSSGLSLCSGFSSSPTLFFINDRVKIKSVASR